MFLLNLKEKREGKLIANLVKEMVETTPSDELLGFVAVDNEKVIGCIFFSKFTVPSSKKTFLLSPVAVATNHQKKGIGQKLINFGIQRLKVQDVELLLTYGDPKFYSKVGFQQIKETTVKDPQKLSFPDGWLAQSLNDDTIAVECCKTSCIKALNKPQYW